MENYEQKYKEDLEAAKGWLAIAKENNNKIAIQILENLFPELKESEDEKIREALLEYFGKQYYMSDWNGIYGYEVYAWLEKQGDKVGAIEGFSSEFERQISHLIASAINKEHEYNQGYVKWTAHALLEYAKKEIERQGEKPALSEEDERHRKRIVERLEDIRKSKENNIDVASVILSEINWLKSIKDRIGNFDDGYKVGFSAAKHNQWKPTEQNIKDLEWCADLVKEKMGVGFHRLQVLIDELKKL